MRMVNKTLKTGITLAKETLRIAARVLFSIIGIGIVFVLKRGKEGLTSIAKAYLIAIMLTILVFAIIIIKKSIKAKWQELSD